MQKSAAAVISACQADETAVPWIGRDTQQPHTRDEVYVVRAGRARFVTPELDRPVGPGDLVFVPAHSEHRFEDMAEGFSCWVLFYGPEGGEAPA